MIGTGSLSPHGESGLKYTPQYPWDPIILSLPTRGEWVEIGVPSRVRWTMLSLPTRGEWVEMYVIHAFCRDIRRLSPHGESGLKSPRKLQTKWQ